MQYCRINDVNKPVSRILFGTAAEPFFAGQEQNQLLDEMLSVGVNAFDTARGYGNAEKTLGIWMKTRNNREKVVILSKCGHPDREWNSRVNEGAIRQDLEASLDNLGTDYIDIYLLHRDDPSVPVGEIVELFNTLHYEGRIGAFGGSNWTARRIAEANAYAKQHGLIPFSLSSPNFGLADQVRDPWGGGCVSISGPSNRGEREWYEKNQMPVIAYSSLGRGLFSGRLRSDDLEHADRYLDEVALRGYGSEENYERLRRCERLAAKKGCAVPQIAMAWLFHQRMNTFAVVSTSSKQRMLDNAAALNIELSERECAYLDLEVEQG